MVRKKDNIYTVNRWNTPRFRADARLFLTGGEKPAEEEKQGTSQLLANPLEINDDQYLNQLASAPLGSGAVDPSKFSKVPDIKIPEQQAPVSGLLKIGSLLKSGGAGVGAAASVIGGLGKSLISNGLSTKAGEGTASVGSALGSAVSSFNPLVGAAISAGSNLAGGIVNSAFGYKLKGDKEAKENIARLNNVVVDDSSADSIENQMASTSLGTNIVTAKNGWLTNKGTEKAAEFNKRQELAQQYAQNSFNNAIQNNQTEQKEDMLSNYVALGGDTKAGNDNISKDYARSLTSYAKSSRKWRNTIRGPLTENGDDALFALGGNLGHGADFSNGVTKVNAGKSHEENPHNGVQMGKDGNGTPNLVEEGEVVWNDKVFTDRIKVPEEVRRKLKVHGRKDMSFAEAANKIQKESEERPNDPISKAGLNAALGRLFNAQEDLKQQMEEDKARAEFEALSPEEKKAVMQQIAMAQQQALQEAQQQEAQQQEGQAEGQQEMAQQQAAQEASPEEAQAAAMQEEQANVAAYGGNLYGDGGDKKKKTSDYLSKYLPGMTINELVSLILSGNKKYSSNNADNLAVEKRGDTVSKEQLLDMLNSDEMTPSLTDYLERAYWQNNPEAANSMVRFSNTPYKTWNPLKIGTNALQGKYWVGGAESPKGDWYLPISEESFHNDPAYKELSDEQKKLKGQELAKALEKTKTYTEFRDYLKGNEEEALKWLGNLSEHGSKYAGNRVKKNDDGTYAWKGKYSFNDFDKMLQDISYDAEKNKDALSIGHLTTTPEEAWSDRYFLKNSDGSYSRLTGPSDDYELINSSPYETTIDGKNYRDSYYKLKSADAKQEEDKKKIVPILKNENLRYASLLGPVAGLGLWGAGVGKPDTSGLDAAVNMSSVSPIMAGYKTIGDYLTYKPLDRDYYQNQLRAQSGATRRSLVNSGTPTARAAGLLAADNTFLNKSGELARQAEEYNAGQRERTATFNRGTNQFNAEAYNRAALQYASDYNNQKRFNAQLQAEAARAKMDAQAMWYNSLYGNIGQLASGIGEIGRENAQHNMIARMGADGLLGVITPEGNMGSTIVTYADENKPKDKNKGGLTNG